MKYLGGKSRLAKYIVPFIQKELKPGCCYVEPFVGGENIAYEINHKPSIFADSHAELIAMWQAAANGWLPPKDVDYFLYKKAQYGQLADKALTGYIGFACSFSGKWFGGFRSGLANPHRASSVKTYSELAFSSAQKKFPKMRGKCFIQAKYQELEIPKNSVVYCDPPYAGTTNYTGQNFDTRAFFLWAENLVHTKNAIVLVSEYAAPKPFLEIWKMPQVKYTSLSNTGVPSIEKLFILKA